MKKYYSLLVKETIQGIDKWCIHFGDFDKEVVKEELNTLKESDKSIQGKIITTDSNQSAIDAKVLSLNNALVNSTDVYALAVLNVEEHIYYIAATDKNKVALQQIQETEYKHFKTRILKSDSNEGLNLALENLNIDLQDKLQKSQLSLFSISDIVLTMIKHKEYKHTSVFCNKNDAITFINNFTGYMSRNGYNGVFKTTLTPFIVNDTVNFLTIFENKQGN